MHFSSVDFLSLLVDLLVYIRTIDFKVLQVFLIEELKIRPKLYKMSTISIMFSTNVFPSRLATKR